MKKVLSLVLVVVMLASMAVLTVSAAAQKIGTSNTTWEITGDTLTIAGTGEMPDNTDYKTTPWWSSEASIKKIVVKSGVTVIGSQSFCHFSALEEIVIEEGVTKINGDAFAYINNDEDDNIVAIKKLTYPTTITTLAQGVFWSSEIETVSCTGKLADIKKQTIAGSYNESLWAADWGETKVTSGTIPAVAVAEGVTGNAEIKWAVKDGVLTVTGEGAMPNFASGDAPWALLSADVKEIVVSDGITYVGNQSFSHMDACEKITFGKKVTVLGADAMSYNKALKTIIFNAPIAIVGQGTVYSSGAVANVTVTGQTQAEFLAIATVKPYNDNYNKAEFTVNTVVTPPVTVNPPATSDATVYMIVVAVVALVGMAVVAVKKVNA